MADVKGCLFIGFSVTPGELTVVTDQGHTVTLIDTGVELVDSYRTIVARATNGEKYPIVVNESQSGAAIGANWQHDEGGNPNADGRDYVKIIDRENVYVNVKLINWLMQFGADFRVTFNDVYIQNGTGNQESGLLNYSCHLGDIMQINSYSGTRQSFIYDDTDGYLINCAGNGYGDTIHQVSDYKVSINPSDTVAYNNYWVLKALGVPMSIVQLHDWISVIVSGGGNKTITDIGVRSIGGASSIVAIDTNGDEFPVCVDVVNTPKFIGSDWGYNTGGDVSSSGVPYIRIIDPSGDYVNANIIPWLASRGATFANTFPACYVYTQGGTKVKNILSTVCLNSGEIALVNNSENNYTLGTPNEPNTVNCEANDYTNIAKTNMTIPALLNGPSSLSRDNYQIIKALGIPTTLFE